MPVAGGPTILAVCNTCYMQASTNTSITLPAADVAHIARLLERCADHEDQRAHGRVTFPLLVMRELTMEARHWAKYLDGQLPPSTTT